MTDTSNFLVAEALIAADLASVHASGQMPLLTSSHRQGRRKLKKRKRLGILSNFVEKH